MAYIRKRQRCDNEPRVSIRWTGSKQRQNLYEFLEQVYGSQSRIDMARHEVSQQMKCICKYAQLFNTIQGVTQQYQQNARHDDSRCDRYQVVTKTKGVIDMEDIIAECGGKYAYQLQGCQYMRTVLTAYFGLLHTGSAINFKQFISILQPRYSHTSTTVTTQNNSQNSKILNILQKIRGDLQEKTRGHRQPQASTTLFKQFIQIVLRQSMAVQKSRQRMSSSANCLYQYLNSMKYVNNDMMNKSAIRQILHQTGKYTNNKYMHICNYIFGNQDQINIHYLIPNITKQHNHNIIPNIENNTQKQTKLDTTIKVQNNGIQNINNICMYSKLQTCQLMHEIDDIQTKYLKKYNKYNRNIEIDNKQNKTKVSKIGQEINNSIDQKLNKIMMNKRITHANKSTQQHNHNTLMHKNRKQNSGGIQDGQNMKENDIKIYDRQLNRNMSQATLKIKQIQAKAMQRYYQDRHNRITLAKQRPMLLQNNNPLLYLKYSELQHQLFLQMDPYPHQFSLPYYPPYLHYPQPRPRQILHSDFYATQDKILLQKQFEYIKNGNIGRIRTQF